MKVGTPLLSYLTAEEISGKCRYVHCLENSQIQADCSKGSLRNLVSMPCFFMRKVRFENKKLETETASMWIR